MAGIVRIDDEVIDTDYFVRTLKLTGQFEGLVEQLVREKLTVLAARKGGMAVPAAMPPCSTGVLSPSLQRKKISPSRAVTGTTSKAMVSAAPTARVIMFGLAPAAAMSAPLP